MDITLITPPRSASNFFIENLVKATDSIKFHKSHTFDNFFKSPLNISIIRDPQECIASTISLDIEATKELSLAGFSILEHSQRVVVRIDYYLKFLKILKNNKNFIVFKYEEVIKNPEKYISFCAEKLNIAYEIKEIIPNDKLFNDGYHPTSLNFEHYSDVLNQVKLADLTECYAMYDSIDFTVL